MVITIMMHHILRHHRFEPDVRGSTSFFYSSGANTFINSGLGNQQPPTSWIARDGLPWGWLQEMVCPLTRHHAGSTGLGWV